MIDNQEEKLSPQQKNQRDKINNYIESIYPGKSISAIIDEIIPTKRGTYYKNVVKTPIPQKFIKWVNKNLKVDISILFNTNENTFIEVKEEENVFLKLGEAQGIIKMIQKELDLQKEKNSSLMSKLNELYEENKIQVSTIKKLESELRRYLDKSGTDDK